MEHDDSVRMEPLADSVFSYLFSDRETTVSMQEIINNVLTNSDDHPIKEITRMDSQYSIVGEKLGARGGRLDIRAVAEDNTLFDIEIQLSSQAFMNDRAWFYGSRLLSESFHEGEDYRQMPRVRVINLLDFILREDHEDYLQPIGVMYKKAPVVVATDAFRIYNLELPKFRASYPTLESAKQDPLASWLYLLDSGYKNEREMEVLMEMSEGMKAFAKKYNRSLKDPKLRDLYELDLSARRDQAAIAYTAKLEAYTSTIRNMLGDGMPTTSIYKYVDAPRSEVDAIIAKVRASSRV